MKVHKKRHSNTFINVIKENYGFLLLLVFLTIIISIQGCQPQQPIIDIGGLSLGNCCKIKDSATLETKACIASTPYPGTCADGSIDCTYSNTVSQSECADIASQTGSSYELVPASDCLNFQNNPDCGTDINNHTMGCYLGDGSGNYKFYTQAWPLDAPQFDSLSCNSAATSLYMCNRGRQDLVQDCSLTNEICDLGKCVPASAAASTTSSSGGGGGGGGGSGGGAETEIISQAPVDTLGGKQKNITQETIMPEQTPSATEKPTYVNLFPIQKPKSKLESLSLYLRLNLPVFLISLIFLILLIIAGIYSYKKLREKKK